MGKNWKIFPNITVKFFVFVKKINLPYRDRDHSKLENGKNFCQYETLLPEIKDDLGFTPLHYSTWLGKEEETLKLLRSGETVLLNSLKIF